LGSDDAEVHFARSKLLLAAGDERLALAALHRAVKARPNWLAAVNNLAWHLVAASEANLRDPALAMSLARRAARLSSRSNPTVLETLAVVLEANRRSQEAIAVLDEAQELALANGDTALAARLTEHRLKWLVELESP
jgi:tetratricopeptide (TPR) repeat protein